VCYRRGSAARTLAQSGSGALELDEAKAFGQVDGVELPEAVDSLYFAKGSETLGDLLWLDIDGETGNVETSSSWLVHDDDDHESHRARRYRREAGAQPRQRAARSADGGSDQVCGRYVVDPDLALGPLSSWAPQTGMRS
jgi:hypothetical protein